MSRRRRAIAVCVVVLGAAVAAPASAWAHAALLRTDPVASAVAPRPPARVSLTFSEAVEPRFATVSVTDAQGRRQTDGAPRRAAGNADTLVVPLHRLAQGWYLVYWRVISVDGHPVRGAFTFAVGPNAGPAPEFVIPSLSETAATPRLIVMRWIVFLTAMVAIGLFVFRTWIARPLPRRVRGVSLRAVTVAFAVALVAALVAVPVYVLMATAEFALRSTWDVGTLVPLIRASSFGRGYLTLEIVLALFAFAAAVTLRVERPELEQRPVSELLGLGGAVAAAVAALLVPGVSGHAGQTSPRAASVVFDVVHLGAGAVWLGGLVGLLLLWWGSAPDRRLAGFAVCVPRFSRVALWSVLLLVTTGVAASIVHLPTLASLWETSYGKTILVKAGLLLGTTALASVNLARNTPRIQMAEVRPTEAEAAGRLLRGLVSGEAVLVVGAIAAAAVLSSLAPPPKALAAAGAAQRVGPGQVAKTVRRGPYSILVRVDPNRAAVPNAFSVTLTKGGAPVRGADVTATFTMLDMEMGQLSYRLAEVAPGVYSRSAPALVMVGHWGLAFAIVPRGGSPLDVTLVDRAGG